MSISTAVSCYQLASFLDKGEYGPRQQRISSTVRKRPQERIAPEFSATVGSVKVVDVRVLSSTNRVVFVLKGSVASGFNIGGLEGADVSADYIFLGKIGHLGAGPRGGQEGGDARKGLHSGQYLVKLD